MLKLNLKKGDSYSLSSINNKFGDDGTAIQMVTKAEYSILVEDVKTDGRTMITLRLDRFGFTVNSKEGKVVISLDSKIRIKEKMRKVDQELYDGVMKIIGFTFWIELNERGEILRTNVDTAISIHKGDRDIKSMVSGNSKMIIGFVSFAEHPVKKGDSWKAIGMDNKEGKVLSGTSNFVLQSIHSSNADISFSIKGWGNVPDGNNIENMIHGTSTVDIQTGWLTKAQFISELNTEGSRRLSGKSEQIVNVRKK